MVHPSARSQPMRMVRLLTLDDAFGAKVVAARLGVEGIVWELRGGVDGPYPFGPVHVFVTEEDLAEARAVLAAVAPLDEEAEEEEEEDEPGTAPGEGRNDRRAMMLGAALLGLLALAAAELVRVLALR